MAHRLRFGLELDGAGHRMVINVPLAVADREYTDSRYFLADDLSGYNEATGTLRVAPDLKALGRIRDYGQKVDAVRRVTERLGRLIEAPAAEEADPRLKFMCFRPMYTDFGLIAEVELPTVAGEPLEAFVKRSMVKALLDLRYLDDEPALKAQDMYNQLTSVEVSSETGVDLRLSIDSSIHTMAEDYAPGDQRVELVGNNVAVYVDPLVYLVGLTALAHADEYIT